MNLRDIPPGSMRVSLYLTTLKLSISFRCRTISKNYDVGKDSRVVLSHKQPQYVVV